MKPFTLLLSAVVLFAACAKEKKVIPKSTNQLLVTTPTSNPVTVTADADTIPDNSGIKVELAKDSINTDETMLLFDKASNPGYDPMEDGKYFAGNGQVSMASICSDGTKMAISHFPYTPGKPITLYVNTKADGEYLLKISYERDIPGNDNVWLRDTYLKDSVDLRVGNYLFNVAKADTNTFGGKRFQLLIQAKSGQRAVNVH